MEWLEKKLLQYAWYRAWQAKRSRKRLAKLSLYKDADDEVESYTATSVAEEEEKRYQQVLQKRYQQENEFIAEQRELLTITEKARAESLRDEDGFNAILKTFIEEHGHSLDTYEKARERHVDVIVERLLDERDAEKS